MGSESCGSTFSRFGMRVVERLSADSEGFLRLGTGAGSQLGRGVKNLGGG